MGGVKPYPYPKYVWSPTGGWWGKGSKVNTSIRLAATFGVLALGWAYIFKVSANNERRSPPIRPIPSQRWCRHTLEDDPDYPRKLKEYQKTKLSLKEILTPDSHH